MPLLGDVAQRVAADIAIRSGVGHFTDSNTIEHNPDHAVEVRDSSCSVRIINLPESPWAGQLAPFAVRASLIRSVTRSTKFLGEKPTSLL